MKTQFQPELAQRPPLLEIVKAANPILEDEIGEPADRVTASWDFRADERGQPVIELTLTDWAGQTSRDFTLEELQSPETARRRFDRLWGDHLREATRRYLRSLEKVLAED